MCADIREWETENRRESCVCLYSTQATFLLGFSALYICVNCTISVKKKTSLHCRQEEEILSAQYTPKQKQIYCSMTKSNI